MNKHGMAQGCRDMTVECESEHHVRKGSLQLVQSALHPDAKLCQPAPVQLHRPCSTNTTLMCFRCRSKAYARTKQNKLIDTNIDQTLLW